MTKSGFLAVALSLSALTASGCSGGDDDDDGSSTPEPNSQWRIEIRSADVPETNPATGETWDIGGGLPDPFVCIVVGAGSVLCSTPTLNTTDPVWNYTFPDSFSHAELASDFEMAMLDEDSSVHDVMIEYGPGPMQADTAGQQKDITLTGSGFTIIFRVKP